MRILRRFDLINQDAIVIQNIKKLKNRQEEQLSLLQPLSLQTDKTLLDKKIKDLLNVKDGTVFNTFATRCLKPEIKNLNALADVNIERVLEKGRQKVPFSVKDHLKVEGMIQSCGFADNLIPSKVSSQVVSILQKQDCIAFAHSNVPQGLLGIQSSNPVYGLSKNPHNYNFISGGSSGGQAALVSAKACAFGLGSDSGGSVRIPAAFCGVYSFKPTGSKRLSTKGRVGPSGIQGIKIGDLDPSFGFLTRSIQDLNWLCQKTIGKSQSQTLYGGQWDKSRLQAAKRCKLKIGYIYKSPDMRAAPGIINTIDQTLQLLKAKGHTIVQFNFPDLYRFRNFFFQYIHMTNFLVPIYNRLAGHAVSSQLRSFYDAKLFGKMGLQIMKVKYKDTFIKQMLEFYSKETNTIQFFKIHKEISEIKARFKEQWKKQDIDILISPVMPFTAPLTQDTDLLVYQLTYCCFQNVLQMPAGVIPTRLVKKNETIYEATNQFQKMVQLSINKSQNLPLAIQVTGEHLRDEQCLGAMWQISKLCGNYIQPKL